jgi:integrase/recombinase XerC/integrase/recombinase XerD
MDLITQDAIIIKTDTIDYFARVDCFIRDQDIKESSKQTYRRSLRQYMLWMTDKQYLPTAIAREHILEFKQELLDGGKSSLTIGGYLTAVRKFYEWLEANKIYPNVARGIKTPKRKQQFKKQPLNTSQAVHLLENSYGALRDYAMVNLLLRTGLRTIEAVRANISDIQFKGTQRVLMVHGKGRDEKDNFVVLTDKAYEPIACYLRSRKAVDTAPLFVSSSNRNASQRLTTRSISRLVKTRLKATGLNDKAFTAHSLRHTTAINILRSGGTLEQAQYTLRHSNIATTQIYTATLNEERRLAHSGEALIDNLF